MTKKQKALLSEMRSKWTLAQTHCDYCGGTYWAMELQSPGQDPWCYECENSTSPRYVPGVEMKVSLVPLTPEEEDELPAWKKLQIYRMCEEISLRRSQNRRGLQPGILPEWAQEERDALDARWSA